MSPQQPVWRKCHLCCLLGRCVHRWGKWGMSPNQLPWWHWGQQAKVNRSLLARVFLGIMLGLGMGHQKAHSDCSLERYWKPWNLARTVRAEAFQWNHKWYGLWAKQRQAVQSHAQTTLLSALWLYCTSSAKLKKCRGKTLEEEGWTLSN